MREITSINELMAELKSGNYNYYGLRGAHDSDLDKLDRGYLDRSYWWDRDTPTDEQLNGTCALDVHDALTAQQIMDRYTTAHDIYAESGVVLLIADSRQEYGADADEVILGSNGYGADVVAIVRL